MGKYFTISELTRSDTAKAKAIANTPSTNEMYNITTLIDEVLDPIREQWGGPIYVNSGYRSQSLNKAIGGSPTSQHVKGEAADIDTRDNAKNKKLFELIVDLIGENEIKVGQLIWEKGNSIGPDWIHVSLGTKNQILYL